MSCAFKERQVDDTAQELLDFYDCTLIAVTTAVLKHAPPPAWYVGPSVLKHLVHDHGDVMVCLRPKLESEVDEASDFFC